MTGEQVYLVLLPGVVYLHAAFAAWCWRHRTAVDWSPVWLTYALLMGVGWAAVWALVLVGTLEQVGA